MSWIKSLFKPKLMHTVRATANTEEEAMQLAKTKLRLWEASLRRSKKQVVILDRTEVVRRINDVTWQCKIEVEYEPAPTH